MKDASAEVLALKWIHRLARTGRLTELRESAGLFQADVARALGVNPATVSRWESGAMRPRGPHAVALRALLDPEGS